MMIQKQHCLHTLIVTTPTKPIYPYGISDVVEYRALPSPLFKDASSRSGCSNFSTEAMVSINSNNNTTVKRDE